MSYSAIPVSDALQHVTPISPPSPSLEPALHRGILLIEPDLSLLSVETLLLSESNYCVTPAFSHGEVFILRETKAVALVVISNSLGAHFLRAVAETVRRQWPLARILILGQASVLEDHLYDEQIERSLDPKQLLADLERLYKDSWNQRSNTVAWKGGRSCACSTGSPLLESDPTKVPPVGVTDNKSLRGMPSGIMWRQR